ncbi:SMAD/FHA domain-containing protein, partial [Hyaloraphidium curvatum]
LRVRESQAPGIGVGLVLVVDGSGVTIGRDRSSAGNRLRLKEMPVSKSHATIFVDFEGSEGTGAPEKASREPEPAQYYIVDVGSTHGTFVNDDRMSAAKTASKPRPLKHGDVLRIGSSVFDVHLHPPPWDVCEECKLVAGKELKTTSDPADGARGVPLEERERASTPKDSRRARLDREFREELGDLKKRLLGDTAPRPTLADGYVDRSKRRRQLHGRDRTPYAGGSRSTEPGGPSAPAASLSTPVGGKGAALLQKMGYAGGGGLGKRGDGLTEPVEAVGTRGTTGLGF